MANGYKPPTANITKALANILESRERRTQTEQASEERILALQRDIFESDRDYAQELSKEVEQNLLDNLNKKKSDRLFNINEFRDKYLTSPFETYSAENSSGYSGLVDSFGDDVSDEMANTLAGLIWSSGKSPNDPQNVISFAELLLYETTDVKEDLVTQVDKTFEKALDEADIVSKDNVGSATALAEILAQRHQDVITADSKLQDFRNINPFIRNKNIDRYDMGEGVSSFKIPEREEPDDDDDDDDDDTSYVFPFTTDLVQSVFDMSPKEQQSFFRNFPGGAFQSPIYQLGGTQEDINANLSMNTQSQLGLDELTKYYLEIAEDEKYNLSHEDMSNLTEIIKLKEKHLENEEDKILQALKNLEEDDDDEDDDEGDYNKYYMGKMGHDLRTIPKAGYEFLLDNQYADSMKKIIIDKRDILRAKNKLENHIAKKETQTGPTATNYQRDSYYTTLERLELDYKSRQTILEDALLVFNDGWGTKFDSYSIPMIEQTGGLSKNKSPNDIMKRRK